MSSLNQCTYAITGNTPLLQYYRICMTCSKDQQIVRSCLNCISICHENHKIGPVLREKFYCQCHVYAQHCCRALTNFSTEDDLNSTNLGNGSTKKRRRSTAATTEDTPEKTYVIWSRHNQDCKRLVCSYASLEEANEQSRHVFVTENPWGWTERDLVHNDEYNIATNRVGNVVHRVQDIADGEIWTVGTAVIDSFLEEVNRQYKPQYQRLSDLKQATNNTSSSSSSSAMKASHKSSLGFHMQDDQDDDEMVIFATTNKTNYDEEHVHKDEKKAKRRPRKEAGAPKGPVHSFMIFSNMNRDRIQAENPGISMVDLSKVIGAKWKEMDSDVRQPYEELAIADRMRYAKEMEEYRRKKADGTLEIPPPKIPGKRGPRKKKPIEAEAFAEASVSSNKQPNTKEGDDESISDASSSDIKDDNSVDMYGGEEVDEDSREMEVKEEEADLSRDDDDENSETIMFAK